MTVRSLTGRLRATLHRDAVETLLPAWEELFASDDRATPFQSPSWGRAWWRWWGDDAQPWTVAVWDAGELIGLAPFASRRTHSMRVLRVLGEEPGDYWDILALPDRRVEVEQAVAAELYRRRDQWDAIVISRLPANSTTPEAFASAGLRTRLRAETVYPGMGLPSTWDAYLETLTSKARTNTRRRLRTLDDGELEVREPSVAELPQVFHRWQDIRIRQWRNRGRELIAEHASDRFREFLVDVAAALAAEKLVAVWEFLRGGDVVGSYVNFCDRRAFYQYLGGYEPELGSLGIGRLATIHGIRCSIASGRRYYDFARGGEAYKYSFGAVDHVSPTVVVTSSRARSRGALFGGLLTGRLS
jgi:CelD/BcsL family acetyltransferase involved in cellulose biosynthesis